MCINCNPKSETQHVKTTIIVYLLGDNVTVCLINVVRFQEDLRWISKEGDELGDFW